MSQRVRTQDTEKLIARWERKLERLHLGVPTLLCRSELFTRLSPRTLDKCQWYAWTDDLEFSEQVEQLRRVLKTLSYRERTVISLYYGINEGESYTFKSIGQMFRISSRQVAQIHANAMRKLSDKIVGDAADTVPPNH